MQCSICSGPVDDMHGTRHPEIGEVYWTGGHNAEPVNDGRCCTVCNDMVVIPSRIKRLKTIKDQPKWYGNPNPEVDKPGKFSPWVCLYCGGHGPCTKPECVESLEAAKERMGGKAEDIGWDDVLKDCSDLYEVAEAPEDGSGLKGKLPKGLLEPPDRGCKSTMTMSKWDIRSILELMVSMQRDAGVTIAGILDEAVSYTVGTYHSDETDGHEFAVSPRLGHCTWGCEESPVMLCVYDSYKDPAMDECLYCGLPDERK